MLITMRRAAASAASSQLDVHKLRSRSEAPRPIRTVT
jgi:hypothetical protein